MNLRDEKTADLAGILTEIGETVTWQGQSYIALVSEPTISEQLNLGGFVESGDFTIKIMRSAFTGSKPKLGDLIGFEDEEYRVTRVTDQPQYPMLVLVVTPKE